MELTILFGYEFSLSLFSSYQTAKKMKPISNQSENLTNLLAELEDKIKQAQGENSTNSSRVKRHSAQSMKHRREDSNSGSGSTTPRLVQSSKKKEDTKPTSDGSVINGDPHTPPVRKRQFERTSRIKEEQIQRVKKENTEENSSASTTPRSVRFATSDTPDSTPVSNRSAATTPRATPRATKDDSSEDSSGSSKPKTPRTKELRKRISKGFSKAGLNIGKLGEKISSAVRASVVQSPKSSGRNSPEVQPSTRSSEKSNPFPEITPSIKNQAARALLKFESDEGYKNSTVPQRRITLLGALVQIMNKNDIEIEPRKIKMLEEEALERSKFSVVDAEIDIQTEPYLASVKNTFKYIESVWGSEKGDRGNKYLNMTENEKKKQIFVLYPCS